MITVEIYVQQAYKITLTQHGQFYKMNFICYIVFNFIGKHDVLDGLMNWNTYTTHKQETMQHSSCFLPYKQWSNINLLMITTRNNDPKQNVWKKCQEKKKHPTENQNAKKKILTIQELSTLSISHSSSNQLKLMEPDWPEWSSLTNTI